MIDDHYHSETLPLPHSYDQTRRQMASYQVRYNYATGMLHLCYIYLTCASVFFVVTCGCVYIGVGKLD